MSLILLLEDDENLGFVVNERLTEAGYNVIWCKNWENCQKQFLLSTPDLMLCDVMLPNIDGFEVVKEIRRINNNIPILFITARDMVEDRIKGFQSGGDDYITKPFSMEELLHRIQVFIRRSNGRPFETIQHYTFGNVRIDFLQNKLDTGSFTHDLTDKEIQLLQMMIGAKGRILKREEILLKIWGDDDYFLGRSLDVFISRLRKYLKGTSIQIKNHHGIGFQWKENALL